MALKCGASRDLPLDTDSEWDGGAARASILEWAGSEPAKIGLGFLAHDTETQTYVLPFARVRDGVLTAYSSGLREAAAGLPRLEDISDEDRVRATRLVDGYMETLHEEKSTDDERSAGGILLSRWNLDTRASKQPHASADLPEDLLAQIHDPSILESGGMPYLNKAWASTDLVDTYFTRMLPTTLKNFAEDATNGIAIQNAHRTDEQALGRTYKGTFKGARAGQPARTEMDFYIPPNLTVNGTPTNHIIDGIRWGTVKDVSVGFYGGELRCSMCQKPMMRDLFYLMFFGGDDDEQDVRDPEAPCHHLPGVEYATRDKLGKKTDQREVAVGEIDGAHCAELSFVFDGSTPQAQIKGRQTPGLAKAIRMAEMEVLPRRPALAFESQFRGVRLGSVTSRRFPGFRTAELHVLEPVVSGRSSAEDDPPPSRQSADEPSVQSTTPPVEGAPMPDPSDRATEQAAPPAEPAKQDDPPASTAAAAPTAPPDPIPSLRAAMVATGLAPDGFTGDINVRFRELSAELTDLRTWADVGKQAREALVEECKKAGVRAFGPKFREGAYAPILTRGSYAELKALHETFEEQGTARFRSGRLTEDDGDPPRNGHAEAAKVPDRAFRA